MRRKGLFIFLSTAIVILIFSFISENEINQRIHLKQPFLEGIFPEEDPSLYQLRHGKNLNSLWSVIRINRIPDTREYVAVEKGGVITKFEWDDPSHSSVVLDLRDVVMTKGESGFLDLAFHPQFHNSASEHYREVYLAYNYAFNPEEEETNYQRLSKFYFTEDLSAIDRFSEEILIQQFAENPNHNGGKLFFDDEEYLYFTVGDEGGFYDLYRNGQKISRELFSGILRLDVNNDSSRSHPIRRQPVQSGIIGPGEPQSFTQNYMIPDDNPWIDESGRVLEEFYAIGLRNPFTATWDPESGGIWVGDVGQEGQEEISLMTKGANGQWPFMEGLIRHQETPAFLNGTEVVPSVTHDRGEAKSIICGYVYRGDEHPDLKDKLIYGDFITGTLWSYDPISEKSVVISGGGRQVLQIFEGPDNDIHVLVTGGTFFRLVPPQPASIPKLLSETGAFENLTTMTPANGLLSYEVNAPLWSDGAGKQRWIAIPDGRPVEYQKRGPWIFRSGTVFIKHFEMNMGGGIIRRLETRFFIKDTRGGAYGLTYKWNEEGTDAMLIENAEAPVDTLEFLDGSRRAWSYPSRSQCLQCHTEAAGFVLGVKTAQLNGPVDWNEERHENQVGLWQDLGLFTELNSLEGLPKMVDISNANANALDRFKSYLDANCASCHLPEGVAPQFDARFLTPIEDQQLVFKDTEGFNSIRSNHLITPGDTTTSELFRRDVEEKASWKMPPLARNTIDTAYINFLKMFITDLGTPVEYVCDTVCEGETYYFQDSTYRVIDEDLHDTIQFTGSFGIDSTVIYELIALPREMQFVTDSVCFGGSYRMPSGEILTEITTDQYDSSWVESPTACNLVITELLVEESNIPCDVIPLVVSVGPNPVDLDYLIVTSNLELQEVTLTDVSGNRVNILEVSNFAKDRYQILLPENVVDGLYILTVTGGNQLKTRKLILDR